jgi:adenylate kinase family enzyme
VRVLITGASGSGQTTLAQALGAHQQASVLDGDAFFWHPSEPPYQHKRSERERHDLLIAAVTAYTHVFVAGSVVGWGDALENCFDRIVFLYVPTLLRLERLRVREAARFGQIDPEFEAWTAAYDAPDTEGRSLPLHQRWLAERHCPVLRIEGSESVETNVQRVLQWLDVC